jgi:LacI family transcriptional regulator
MRGVNRAIADLEYDLIAYTYGNTRKNTSADRERQYVSLLSSSITDGVIIVTPRATDFTTTAPVVAVDPNNETPSCPAVIATNRAGAISAMAYLLALGHRRIGHITGRTDLQSAIRRLQGYEDALTQAGIPIDPQLIQQGDFSTETALICARNLLTLEDRPTAIFAANDQSAMGVIRVTREMGLEVPKDISIIGFDNIPEAEHLNLTTVDQFINEMGFVATGMLIRLISHEELEEQIYKMPTELVIRGSCRAL